MAKINQPTSVQVYYNSACPVCELGVKTQKDKMQACDVTWNDVHADASCLAEVQSELEFVRKQLHVVDENKQLRIGMDAFITLWKHSPREHWKAHLFSMPVIYTVSCYFYNGFAYGLYHWNRWQKNW